MTAPTGRTMPLQSKMRFGFNIFLILLFAYTTYESFGFRSLARYLPLTVSLLALLVVGIGMAVDVMAYRRYGVVAGDDVPMTAALAGSEIKEHKIQAGRTDQAPLADDDANRSVDPIGADGEPIDPADVILDTDRIGEIEPPGIILRRSLIATLWILGFIAAIAVIGLELATIAYLMGYLFLQAKTGWKIPVIGTVTILVMMNVMRVALNLEWPPYLLEGLIEPLLGR